MKKYFIGFAIFFMIMGLTLEVNGGTELKTVDSTYFIKEEIKRVEDIGIDLNLKVFWCASLDDSLLIYVDDSVLEGVGLPEEKHYIENFVEDTKEVYNAVNVSIFVHRKGYYVKNNLPTGLK